MRLSVIKPTVPCERIKLDPLDPGTELNVSKLLFEEFPQFSPYFGVYAVVDGPGSVAIANAEIGFPVFKLQCKLTSGENLNIQAHKFEQLFVKNCALTKGR